MENNEKKHRIIKTLELISYIIYDITPSSLKKNLEQQ